MYYDDFMKVQGLLPTPSYSDTLSTYNNQKIILIYVIEGYIISPNQYRWISNIKLGLQNYLCVPFKFEEDFTINDDTKVTGIIYDVKTLSRAFQAPIIIYPKIMYPATKKELYKCLCWCGARLMHQECFTKEAMTATALLMNKKLDDRYQDKELHKKVLGACMFINENRDNFSVRLDEVQLKEARSRGASVKNANQTQKTKQKIDEAIATGNYFKANGKVNKTFLAKALNIHRRTLDNYF